MVRSAPFQRTTELLTKFVPLTVSVNPAPPGVAEDGLSPVMVGTGLPVFGLTANDTAFDVPPPGVGLNTVTLAVPAVAMSAAVIAAVNWVPLTYVVGRSEPFQRTTELPMKPVPLTVSVKAGPPGVAEDGLRPVMVGTGVVGQLTGFTTLTD